MTKNKNTGPQVKIIKTVAIGNDMSNKRKNKKHQSNLVSHPESVSLAPSGPHSPPERGSLNSTDLGQEPLVASCYY